MFSSILYQVWKMGCLAWITGWVFLTHGKQLLLCFTFVRRVLYLGVASSYIMLKTNWKYALLENNNIFLCLKFDFDQNSKFSKKFVSDDGIKINVVLKTWNIITTKIVKI